MVKNGEEKSSSLQLFYMKLYINQTDSLPNSIGPNGKRRVAVFCIPDPYSWNHGFHLYSYMRPWWASENSTCKTATSATTHTHPRGVFFVHHRLCDRHPCQLSACLATACRGGTNEGYRAIQGKAWEPKKNNMNLGGTNQKLHSERLLKVPLPPLYSLGKQTMGVAETKHQKSTYQTWTFQMDVNSMGPLGLNRHPLAEGARCGMQLSPHRTCAASLMNKK